MLPDRIEPDCATHATVFDAARPSEYLRVVPPTPPLAIVLLVPLGLIWFPEELGGFTGYVSRGGNIDSETPPGVVTFVGWVFLVLIGIPIVAISLGYK